MTKPVFEVKQGTSPIILGFPHTGTDVPPAIWERLNDTGRLLTDTVARAQRAAADLALEAAADALGEDSELVTGLHADLDRRSDRL